MSSNRANRRCSFLDMYLGSLGAQRIEYWDEKPTHVAGLVRYDLNDPEEIQQFRWNVAESEVPSEKAYRIIEVIFAEKLLDIDKIKVDSDELFARFLRRFGESNRDEYNRALEELLSVKVPMVDEGQETDYYFIHF
jgi:hypothetical protein